MKIIKHKNNSQIHIATKAKDTFFYYGSNIEQSKIIHKRVNNMLKEKQYFKQFNTYALELVYS